MQKITQSFIGILALSTMCGVLMHDTHIDKATVHVLTHLNGNADGGVSVSSHPHTHSERNPLGGKAQAATARDPRDDKVAHHDQSDYFRLPGSADMDNTLVLV
ncbi:hypothetical protein I8H83_05510 [Candidatus Saccharibacteria bacterium]|nr:hypothetical protein [Candidatus Saccharibacteria bacterium]MBH2008030.1 hypothetical protein [Candidatus Saccharibacteria bacterium]